MRLLVTGGAGFIGSNFILFIMSKYPNLEIVNLDLLTYAGNLDNLLEVANKPNYHFVQGNICDRFLVESLFEQYEFDGVIHFSAESHVDNAIRNPEVFIETNVKGTFTLLEVARNFWMEGPQIYKEKFKHSRFHHISTDEVYGTLGLNGYFTEHSPYAPNSPYSASKAASDMLVRSYYHTYGLHVVTTNCSNNFGPMQHDEKLIPTIIRNALSFKSIPIYGNGMNIRDWLYVEDHCEAILEVFQNGKSGETYLVGGNNEFTNLEIAGYICEYLDLKFKTKVREHEMESFKDLIKFVDDRAGHDFRYAIDSSKIYKELGWQSKFPLNDALIKTVDYYIEKYNTSII